MPRSRESLLDAASTQGREDRLTEVFATVVDACDELAAALFAEVGLPVGERFQVFTQERVTPGERPDMLIHTLDRGGAEIAHIWSEHKVGAGFGDMQRERYLAAMRSLPGPGELIFVVAEAPAAREAGDWRGLTWQEIGELSESVGRAWGDREWRKKALAPSAPSKWRLLYELLWYLEEKEGLAVVHALDHDNLLAYKLMEQTVLAVESLVERAAQNAAPLRPTGKTEDDGATVWLQFDTPADSWLTRLSAFQAAPELLVSDRDYWSPEQFDEPSFAAGYSLERRLHAPLSAKREWVRQLDEAGYCCELWDDWVYIRRTLPMSGVVAFGDTFDAQAKRLGEWTSKAITDLGTLDPGDLELQGIASG